MIDLLENLVVEQYLEIGADFLEESVFAKPNLQIQARAQPTDAEMIPGSSIDDIRTYVTYVSNSLGLLAFSFKDSNSLAEAFWLLIL